MKLVQIEVMLFVYFCWILFRALEWLLGPINILIGCKTTSDVLMPYEMWVKTKSSEVAVISYSGCRLGSYRKLWKPGVGLTVKMAGLRSPGLEFELLSYQWNNTRWVDPVCHPSELSKMSTSLLETGGTDQQHSHTSRNAVTSSHILEFYFSVLFIFLILQVWLYPV